MCSRISCFLFWNPSNLHYIPNETRQIAVIKVFRSCLILVYACQTVGCNDKQVTTVQRLAFLLLPGTVLLFLPLHHLQNLHYHHRFIITSPSTSPSTPSQSPLRRHDHAHLFTFKIIITSFTFNTSTITFPSPSTLS
jgi:hypothetical protein